MGSLSPSTVSSAHRGRIGPNRRHIVAQFQANAFQAIDDDSMKPNAMIAAQVPTETIQDGQREAPDVNQLATKHIFQFRRPGSAPLASVSPPTALFAPATVPIAPFAATIAPSSTPVKNVQNRFKKWRKAESESDVVEDDVQYESQIQTSTKPPAQYFNIQVGKMSMKKHKTWEWDGIMIVDGKKITIIVGDSTKVNTTFKLPKDLVPGETQFQWEGKLILVQDEFSPGEVEDFTNLQSEPKVHQSARVDEPVAKEDDDEADAGMEVEQSSQHEPVVSSLYSILLAKRTSKKHKTWEEDGEMRVHGATKAVTVTIGDSTKSSTTIKLKLPKEIIPGETEFLWEGKLVLVDQLLESE